MYRLFAPLFLVIGYLSAPAYAEDHVVLRAGEIEITQEELAAIVASTPESLLTMVSTSDADLFEFLNSLAVTRQIAAESDALQPDDPAYWELRFALVNARRIFMMKRMVDEMAPSREEIIALAQERYATQKDKYALIPERRGSSHILFAAEMGEDRRELRKLAQSVLDELRAGADWEDMVEEYSEDTGSAARGGKITAVVEFGSSRVTPSYVAALHSIDKVGEYSEITDSPFGIHIIRLDEIVPKAYKPFSEVASAIVGDLENDFRATASKEIKARYTLSPENAYIDDAAVDKLLRPYKTGGAAR